MTLKVENPFLETLTIEVTDIGLQLYRIGRNIKAHSNKNY